MNWEIIHAVTMIPGMFIQPKSITYMVFSGLSFSYHLCKGFRKQSKKTIYYLQRADLTSQLLVCLANSKTSDQRFIIMCLLLCVSQLNIQREKQRRVHLVINGLSILICNGFKRPAIYLWSMVFNCCVIMNLTHIQFFHSAMHLFGHAAFSLQER